MDMGVAVAEVSRPGHGEGTLVVLPEGGPHAGGVVNRMAAISVTVSRAVETADTVVPAAHCEIVYEIPIDRHQRWRWWAISAW